MRAPTWHETVATQGVVPPKSRHYVPAFCYTYTHMNRISLFVAFVLALALLLLHLYALDTYFYWYHRWFDIPMHVLGGAAIGMFLISFFGARRTFFYFACMAAVVVGWEVFEYVGSISPGQSHYWLDTAQDLLDGLIGAAIALFGVRFFSLWR